MKIYLAGGFPISLTGGRERELVNKLPIWRRLYSFYYRFAIDKSEILIIKQEYENISNQQNHIRESLGDC